MKPEVFKDEGYRLMGAAFEVYSNLINFGHKDTLEWNRIILSEFIPSDQLAQISAD
jgi:hypothetical protein